MNIATYLKEIRRELSLTTFPKQEIVINFTLFVVLFAAVMAVYLGGLDLIFGESVISLLNNYGNQDTNGLISTTTDPLLNASTSLFDTIISTTTATTTTP